MLFLIFKIGDEKFAIQADKVVEVVDLVNFTKIPQTPEYISGLMNYRGEVLPVVDLAFLFLKRIYNPMLSTRIVLIDIFIKKKKYTLGLIAENLTETIKFEISDIKMSGVKMDEIPYLGEVISKEGEITHLLEVEKILPEEIKLSIFKSKKR